MIKLIQKLWDINGLKRTVAIIYWSVVSPCMPILWPNGTPGTINKVYLIVGIILSVVGLGHAALKNYQAGKDISTPEVPLAPVEEKAPPAAL